MIEEIDERLREWVTSLVDADVRFEAPRPDVGSDGGGGSGAWVCLHLLEIDNDLPTQRYGRRPLDLRLGYLVTAGAERPEGGHGILDALVVAALERSDWQVELGRFSPEFWIAFKVVPRPAFVLRCPMRVERTADAPLVRTPAETRLALSRPINGVVLTNDDLPMPHVRVELPDLAVSVVTDGAGRFRLGAVPAGPPPTAVRLVAKGTERMTEVTYDDDDGLVARFEK